MNNKLMKPMQTALLLSAIIIVAALFFLLFKKDMRFDNCIVENDIYQEIISSRETSSDLFDSISFNDEELFYDETNNFYLYSLVENRQDSFNPGIEILSSGNNLKIAFLEGTIDYDSISQNKSIPFVVYDDTHYFESSLKCTTLPIMAINSKEPVPDSKEEVVGMSMRLFDNAKGTAKRLQTSEGSMHIRGNATLVYPKKSYKLSLLRNTAGGKERNNNLSLLGMPSDDDWVLNAMYGDPTRTRDVFCANLWKNSMATDNAQSVDLGMEYKYVELFVNGQYNGLYALGYKPRISQVNVSKSSYDNVLFFKRNYQRGIQNLGDNGAPFDFFIRSGQSDEAFELLRSCYMEIDRNKDDLNALRSMVDMDNLAGFYLFINLIQGCDSVDGNQYVLINRTNDNYHILYGPWDMDFSFGMYYSESLFADEYGRSPEDNNLIDYGIIQRLIELDPEGFKEALRDKYQQLRASSWSDDVVNSMLDECEKTMFNSGAYLREMDRWPEAPYVDTEARLAAFKGYVQARFNVMDSHSQDPETDPSGKYESLKFSILGISNFVNEMFDNPDKIMILQIGNKELLGESGEGSFYDSFMDKFGIPEEYRYEDMSLCRQLFNRSGNDVFNNIPDDTGLIVVNGDNVSILNSEFMAKGGTLPLATGDYYIDLASDGTGRLSFGSLEILQEKANEESFNLRLICIDPDDMEVRRIEEW